MSERIGWDKYEVALLIEACNKVLIGQEDKQSLVKKLSFALRSRAVDTGIEIDDVFRNENGISLQMTKMNYILTNGKVGLPGASKLYIEIAEQSKNAPDAFAKLLTEAKNQIGNKGTNINMSNKEHFSQWLLSHPSRKAGAITIIRALDDASNYCLSHNLSKDSLWDIEEFSRFSAVVTRLLEMRIFRFTHRETARTLNKATALYKEYKKKKTDETMVIAASNHNEINLTYSKDDNKDTIKQKLALITEILQKRYFNAPARNLTEVVNSNTDLPIKYINTWSKNIFNQTAAQYLIDKSIIQPPIKDKRSDSERREDNLRQLDDWTKVLRARYSDKSIASLTEMIEHNKDISFSYLNMYTKEIYNLTASEYLQQQGILRVPEKPSKEEKISKVIRKIHDNLGDRKIHSISELNSLDLGITIVSLTNWVKSAYGVTLVDYLKKENIYEYDTHTSSISSLNNNACGVANDSHESMADEQVIDSMELSLYRALEYLKTRYAVRLHYNHITEFSKFTGDMLYKVRNINKDVMWVYYINTPHTHYISIETEPEYLEKITDALLGFTRILRRSSHPRQKMIFTDYADIQKTLVVICNSIDAYFNDPIPQEFELSYSRIYKKLYSISKVYDDPTGLTIDKIMSLLGADVEETIVKNILDGADWASKISAEVYSFSKKSAMVVPSTISNRYTSDLDFDKHLDSACKMADATRKGYVSAIRIVEKFAQDHNFENQKMYNCSFAEAIATMTELRHNQEFLKLNRQRHNRFSGALSKFEAYIGFTEIDSIESPVEAIVNITDEEKDNFICVLMQRYQSGMQFDSIDFDNFRECYDSLFDEKIECDDAILEKKLRLCGVYYNDRLFPADGIIDKATGEKLLSYIESAFASGKTVIYYKAIMTDMADDFVYCFSLTDENMLRAYIEYSVPKNTYYFEKDYMSKERFVKIDHSAEIMDYMLSVGKPLSYEEIYAELSHIASDVIRSEIHTNKMFVMDSKEHYFHIDIFECDDSELNKISEIISNDIEENGYAIWTNVFGQIQDRMPIFIENNPYLGPIGIRNAVSRKLSDKFNFDGAIISPISKQLSMADVYKLYAKHHPSFTEDDIYNFSKELDTVIYFNALYETCIRVSKDLFISRDDINIDIDAVDSAIGTYFSGNYMLVKDIDSFLVFPNVGYEWNQFLLEGFLLSYSKKYMLLNNGTSLYNVAGAVVKRNSKTIKFVDVCADVLANSDIVLNKAKALDYLADMNLITRRSYRDIDRAITLANQIRNRKG